MIEEYIPRGYSKRVSRSYLHEISGIPDRQIRKEIADAVENRGILIISADGGYFIPDKHDGVYVDMYCAQERQRARTQAKKSKRLKRMARAWAGLPEDERDFPGQIRMEF